MVAWREKALNTRLTEDGLDIAETPRITFNGLMTQLGIIE